VGIVSILVFVVGLVNLVLAIMVLIKLFQKEGVVKGILGIICMLYTFIWGWMKAKELQITNIMWGWTACIVVQIILSFVMQASVASQLPQ
jgi:hypothetical protein